MLFKSFGRNTKILGRIKVYGPENITIGTGATINEGVLLNAREELFIGDFVRISPHVIINTGGLKYQTTQTRRSHTAKPVYIHAGAWICSGAIINPGVSIGENAVVGAGAVVTQDIPPNVVAAGVPAKTIKSINE